MSVLVVTDKSVNTAFNIIANLSYSAPIDWSNTYQLIERLRKFDIEYLARWAAIFNQRNFNIEYAHNRKSNSWYSRLVTFRFYRHSQDRVTRTELAQAIRTIQCLRYNMVENYEDAAQYSVLRDLQEKLTEIFTESSPEMIAAGWC